MLVVISCQESGKPVVGQFPVTRTTYQELAKKSDPPMAVDPQSASSDSPSDAAHLGPRACLLSA